MALRGEAVRQGRESIIPMKGGGLNGSLQHHLLYSTFRRWCLWEGADLPALGPRRGPTCGAAGRRATMYVRSREPSGVIMARFAAYFCNRVVSPQRRALGLLLR